MYPRPIKALIPLLLLWCALAVPATADTLQGPSGMLGLAKAGAPGLALGLMDRLTPDPAAQPDQWTDWMRVRIQVLEQAGRWQDLLDQTARLPKGIAPEFRQWVDVQRARAQLALGHAARARTVLRGLILQAGAKTPDKTFQSWQRLIITSYLREDRLQDAQTALQRYQQDYGEQSGDEEQLLRARVLLRLDQPGRALRVVKGIDGGEAKALELLAGLRAGRITPKQAQAVVEKAVKAKGLSDANRARLWYVASLASKVSHNPRSEARQLEQVLAILDGRPLDDRLFTPSADALWDAYLAEAQKYGNTHGFLIGDDQSWLGAGAAATRNKHDVLARALYALEARKGAQAEARLTAYRKLGLSLIKAPGGKAVFDALFLHSKRFPQIADIPPVIRHVLANHALQQGNIPLASRLLDGLDAPPQGVDPFDWELRLARIHILAGQEDRGIDLLYGMLAKMPKLDHDHAANFMQVIFDLQTVKRNQQAINLFTALQPRLIDPQQQREVLYWMAQSYGALGHYQQAAWLYLRSAMYFSADAADPWGQTARFHAAEMLAKAGLVDDARNLYPVVVTGIGTCHTTP
ncbi:MAG: hypothetical protein P8Y64_04560 [Gammaproteobacteria bacterium]